MQVWDQDCCGDCPREIVKEDPIILMVLTTMLLNWRLPSPPGATHTSCSGLTPRRTKPCPSGIIKEGTSWRFLEWDMESLPSICEERTAKTVPAPASALSQFPLVNTTCVQLCPSRCSTITSTSSRELTRSPADQVSPALVSTSCLEAGVVRLDEMLEMREASREQTAARASLVAKIPVIRARKMMFAL